MDSKLPTKEQTRQAINASIKHWENLRDGCGTGLGHGDCALCTLFLHGQDANKKYTECIYCPIAQKTGQPLCRGTPYRAATKLFYPINPDNPERRAAFQAMVDFLKSL